MNLLTYLRAIRKSWWIVVIVILLGTAAGVYRNFSATPIYAAGVTFYVSTASSAADNAAAGDQFAQNRAVSYAKLLSSETLAQRVIDATGLQLTASELASELSGSADLNTVLVTGTIEDPSRARALRIAKGVATEFPIMVEGFDNRTAGRGSVKLIVTSGPGVGAAPILPRKTVNLLYGFGAGLILGLAIAVLRYLRDSSVRHQEEVEAITGAPVLATIDYESTARKQPLVLELDTPTARGEEFRQLRTSLQFIDAASELATLVVTSPDEGEGKSTTAANLALVYAESGRLVLLVDADLRRPRAAAYFGLETAIGLSNVLAGQVDLDHAIQIWRDASMYVLASGSIPPNPSELLGSPAMTALLDRLRKHFDLVIIDTPPLLPVTDALVLAGGVDGVLLVCRHGKTRRAKLGAATRSLQTVNARLVGCVLNMSPARERAGYSYYAESTQGRGILGRRRTPTAPSLPQLPRLPPAETRHPGGPTSAATS